VTKDTKTELLKRIDESRTRLERSFDGLSEADLKAAGADGWSVKDHLAHVAAWEESLLALLEGRDRYAAIGLDPATREAATNDVDAINEVIHRRSQDRSPSDVIAAFQETHARLRVALTKLTDADVLRPYSHYQPHVSPADPRPVAGWIDGDTWEHYDEHSAWIGNLRRDLRRPAG
jgi:uncharacterized protein (TIGR03083 family)